MKLNLFKLYRVVKEEGVANLIEDERSLVAAISSEKCVEDELPKPSNAYGPRSSSTRHLHGLQFCDQAANLYEVLAWSYSLKSVLRTAYIFDVFRGYCLCVLLIDRISASLHPAYKLTALRASKHAVESFRAILWISRLEL